MWTHLCGPSFGSRAIQPDVPFPTFLELSFSLSLAQFLRSCLSIITPSHSFSKLGKNISSFSVQTRPHSAPLHPPVPAEYPRPDYIEEAVPSYMCSLGPLSCPGCTEEERDSSSCPPRRPQPQTQQLHQHIFGFAETRHTTEERRLVCRRKDIEYISGFVEKAHFYVLFQGNIHLKIVKMTFEIHIKCMWEKNKTKSKCFSCGFLHQQIQRGRIALLVNKINWIFPVVIFYIFYYFVTYK